MQPVQPHEASAAVSSVRRVGDVSSSIALSPLRSTPRADEMEAMLALPPSEKAHSIMLTILGSR